MESNEQNPYSPPEANLQADNTGHKIENFPRFSAWAVFGLTIITLGIYYPYWLFTRTRILNRIHENKISCALVNVVIGLFIVNLVLSYISGMNPQDEDLNLSANLINILYAITNLYWVFSFRNRIHQITGADKESGFWLGGILTFFFQVIYLQYKINEYIDTRITKE